MKINSIINKPVITEKSSQQSGKGVYIFEVSRVADKDKVARAIEDIYKVKVDRVRILLRKGKEKRVGRRMMTKKTPDRKIAYIHLLKGEIDIFPKT